MLGYKRSAEGAEEQQAVVSKENTGAVACMPNGLVIAATPFQDPVADRGKSIAVPATKSVFAAEGFASASM